MDKINVLHGQNKKASITSFWTPPSRAGEPEPGVFGSLEPELEPLEKKNQEPEQEPLGKKVRSQSR